jgi:hypothetical protein
LIAFIAVTVGTFALRNPAGQDLFPEIAVIGMFMLGIFIRADQVTLNVGIAAIFNGMDMAVVLFQRANENRLFGIAGIGMNVAVILFQSADQNSFLRLGIAFIGVRVEVTLGQRADENAVFIAVIIMMMGNGFSPFLGIRAFKDTLGISLRLNALLQRAENQSRHKDSQNQEHPNPKDAFLMLPYHSVQSRFVHNPILPFPEIPF